MDDEKDAIHRAQRPRVKPVPEVRIDHLTRVIRTSVWIEGSDVGTNTTPRYRTLSTPINAVNGTRMVLACLVNLDGQKTARESLWITLEKPSCRMVLACVELFIRANFAKGHRCWVGATSWLRNIKPTSDRAPRIGRVYEICLCVHCAPIQWSRRKRPHYKRTVT